MISKQAYPLPLGKRVWGVALGLILGALLPVITLLQVTLLVPVLMLGGVFTVYLYCYAGWPAFFAFLAAGLGSTAWFGGTGMMWMILAAGMLPGALTLRGIGMKQPFFEQLRGSILFYTLGLLAAMGIARASFGGGMVAKLMDSLRAELAAMPDAAFQPLVEALNSALSVSGMQGFGRITVSTYRAQVSGVLDLMQQTYAQSLPGTLLSGALLSGAVSTLWGNWTQARRGLATNESFAGMSRWFLPPQVTIGALALCLAGYVIAKGGYSSGTTVYVTVFHLASAVFGIQALAALDRRMLDAGRSLGRRRTLLTLLVIGALIIQMLSTFLFIIGASSALFGSHGAVTLWRAKKKDDDSNHDDFE